MREKTEAHCRKNNHIMEFSALSVIGDRSEQQDSFGYSMGNRSGVFVVCDGMGGHEFGKLASTSAVEAFLLSYREYGQDAAMDLKLQDCAVAADERVFHLAKEKGEGVIAGCTLVAVAIENDQLHWCSVGDSRAYLCRQGEFAQLTKDQNYKTVLDEQLSAGMITKDVYDTEMKRGDALINYIGTGTLSFIDYNVSPFKTQKDDLIILMTDGLYRLVSDDEIKQIIENFSSVSDALHALVMKSIRSAARRKAKRDNLTVALIKIKE